MSITFAGKNITFGGVKFDKYDVKVLKNIKAGERVKVMKA